MWMFRHAQLFSSDHGLPMVSWGPHGTLGELQTVKGQSPCVVSKVNLLIQFGSDESLRSREPLPSKL